MNPGIYYLYEYENNCRKRNVGFIKIVRHYQSCILQIHARGIPVGNGAALELHAFFRDGNDMLGSPAAVLNCFSRNISVRLPVPESRFPLGRPLSEIDGFLLLIPGTDHKIFWMASPVFFTPDIHLFRQPSAEIPEPSNPEPENTEAGSETETETDTHIDTDTLPETEESLSVPDSSDNVPQTKISELDEPQPALARKIDRSELSQLPRCLWRLADNSFLLHGYHNYSHLLLIEKDGHRWLGVPGIYDPREARAADLFGFPQFTRDYTDQLNLSSNEYDTQADFGYWCRCIDTR